MDVIIVYAFNIKIIDLVSYGFIKFLRFFFFLFFLHFHWLNITGVGSIRASLVAILDCS